MKQTALEKAFALALQRFRLPPAVEQLKFALDVERKWAFDFAWPQFLVAVELNGIVSGFCNGRTVDCGGHGTVVGRTRDMDKGNAAILLGWSVLVFSQSHVSSGDAIIVTQRVLVSKGWEPQ